MLLIPLLVLAPWTVAQMEVALNANHAWLGIAAERLLDGGKIFSDVYDPNPPLSIWLYVPHVWLSRMSGIPYYYMPALLGFLSLGLSALASGLILRRLAPDLYPAIITAYLAGSTYLCGHWDFAERDALMVWGLFPFLLAQIAITKKIALPRYLSGPVLVLGAAAIMIKPHYGLLPALILLHRLITQKRLVVKDPDFIALAAGVFVYVILFGDALRQMMPDMQLYVGLINPAIIGKGLPALAILGILALLPRFFPVAPEYAKPVRLCLLAALLCLGLYFVQMKGFDYHLIPFRVFVYCSFALYLQAIFIGCSDKKDTVTLAAVIIIALLPVFYTAPGGVISHKAYKQTQLAQLVGPCAPECSYYAISKNMDTVLQVSTYTGAKWASRYPVLWWLPPLHPSFAPGNSEEMDKRLQIHIANLAEDLNTSKPTYIAVIINQPLFSTGETGTFDYIDFLSRSPAFKDAMSHYRQTRVIEDDRNAYFTNNPLPAQKHPYIYAIYERLD